MANWDAPVGSYRPYCDECGQRVWPHPVSLGRARRVAQAHANATGHLVRIEPWESYQLIEHVRPVELEDPYPDPDADPGPDRSSAAERPAG